jgi:hypothetical protein
MVTVLAFPVSTQVQPDILLLRSPLIERVETYFNDDMGGHPHNGLSRHHGETPSTPFPPIPPTSAASPL